MLKYSHAIKINKVFFNQQSCKLIKSKWYSTTNFHPLIILKLTPKYLWCMGLQRQFPESVTDIYPYSGGTIPANLGNNNHVSRCKLCIKTLGKIGMRSRNTILSGCSSKHSKTYRIKTLGKMKNMFQYIVKSFFRINNNRETFFKKKYAKP